MYLKIEPEATEQVPIAEEFQILDQLEITDNLNNSGDVPDEGDGFVFPGFVKGFTEE